MFKFLNKNKSKFSIPCTGKLVRLEDVDDVAFSGKCLGDGFAIELTDKKVVSPVDGEIVSLFPTGHAYGILSEKGDEILIHLGIDTVELNGEGFESNVVQGQKVKKGDLLCNVDLEILKSNNKPLTSPIIFTNGSKFNIKKEYGQHVEINEESVVEVV